MHTPLCFHTQAFSRAGGQGGARAPAPRHAPYIPHSSLSRSLSVSLSRRIEAVPLLFRRPIRYGGVLLPGRMQVGGTS